MVQPFEHKLIKSHQLLNDYLIAEKAALNINRRRPKFLGDKIWKFQIKLRKTEYYNNIKNHHILNRILYYYHFYTFKKLSDKYLVEIPLNVIGKGLVIWHLQSIIINPKVVIGENFSISAGCIVGQAKNRIPIIGNNVEMTVGSKILGGIMIADHVTIGAGAVVVKSIEESYTTWGGVPATKISNNFSVENIDRENRVKKVKV
jgi:serine O-acetyltransferase